MPVGLSVTLRQERAYEFLDRLLSIAIPRIRDFRGLKSTSFDGRGNYTIGIREQIIFPEIDYDAVDQVRGLDVTITTSAKTDAEAFALLQAFGMPFTRDGRGPGEDAGFSGTGGDDPTPAETPSPIVEEGGAEAPSAEATPVVEEPPAVADEAQPEPEPEPAPEEPEAPAADAPDADEAPAEEPTAAADEAPADTPDPSEEA